MYELKFLCQHWTLITPLLTQCRQSIAASIQNLPYSTVKSMKQLTMNIVDVAGQTIRLPIRLILAVNFLDIMELKDKNAGI